MIIILLNKLLNPYKLGYEERRICWKIDGTIFIDKKIIAKICRFYPRMMINCWMIIRLWKELEIR